MFYSNYFTKQQLKNKTYYDFHKYVYEELRNEASCWLEYFKYLKTFVGLSDIFK